MKIKTSYDFKPEVATSSLSDIMFFLLLFFLIVSTFANPNVIKLLLPKTDSSQIISRKQITLSVSKNKHYYIDQKQVLYKDIETELLQKAAHVTDATIVVRADYSLSIQELVDVLQIGNKLKIKMILATEKTHAL
jgi:biopolymer transport protein ExbD